MQRRSIVFALAFAATLCAALPAAASERQLHAGPMLGASWSAGRRGGVGGLVAVGGGVDVTDTWRIYAHLEYGLGAGDAANTPRHSLSLATGIAYMIDVLSILPWVGIGFDAIVVITPAWTGFVPAVEARGGVDYLVTRYFGLTLEVSYGFVVANRDQVSDVLSGSIGLRWTVDL